MNQSSEILAQYEAALETQQAVLVRLKNDIEDYKAKNQPLTPGKQKYIDIRTDFILKLKDYQDAAEEVILTLQSQIDELRATKVNEWLNDEKISLKRQLHREQQKNKELEDFMERIGWNATARKSMIKLTKKEEIRQYSILKAYADFNI